MFYVKRAAVNEYSCYRARRAHSLGQGSPTFFRHRPDLLLQNLLCGILLLLQKKLFCPKLGEDQKKGLQPSDSDRFSGVLQRTNQIKLKDSHL